MLRAVHSVLEQHQPLRDLLGHVQGATTVETGARIVGDSVRLQELPLPLVVLSFEGGAALAPQREDASWSLELIIYAEDVYQAAELIDAVEAACVQYRYDAQLEQPLSRLKIESHQRIEPQAPVGRVIAVRVGLSAHWVH